MGVKGAYYNEIDKFAAAWLRELIKAGHIAAGDVDERDIRDVRPDDLVDYTQCHFFAGIGVWSYALRQAGWPDDRPVWTGSCPCQPFSSAGKGGGFADERHLWPAWFHLIEILRPAVVFGEQVGSKDGLAWLDLVQTDMEGAQYAFAPADLCAAGFGAPHIRQRLFFVGESYSNGRQPGWTTTEAVGQGCTTVAAGDARIVADTMPAGRTEGRTITGSGSIAGCGEFDGLAYTQRDATNARRSAEQPTQSAGTAPAGAPIELGRRCDTYELGNSDDAGSQGRSVPAAVGEWDGGSGLIAGSAGAANGFWRDADWLPCIDGKARPVESGTQPLASGVANRVGLLRGYGNSIVAPVAKEFIRAYLMR